MPAQRPYRLAGLLAVLGFASTGAAEEPLADAVYDDLNRAIIEDRIVPAHRALASSAETLSSAMAAYCAAPSAETLEPTRAAFHDTYDDWMRVAWLNFGPQAHLMRAMRVHFWPDSNNALTRQLAGVLNQPRADLLDPAVLADTSVALQGLPALERLLFDEAPPAAGDYACDLAVAIAGNVRAIAGDLATAWSDPAARAATLPEGSMLTASLFQSIYEHMAFILSRKLSPPLGDTLADARPRLAENWRSGRALRNIERNLTALLGVVDKGDGTGFADVVGGLPGQAETATVLVGALQEARSIAQDLQGRPIAELLADQASYDALVAMGNAIDLARETWALKVGAGLGLSIGFNRLDGD